MNNDEADTSERHITGDSVLQSEVLEDLRDAVNYRRWLAELVRPYLGDHPLEIGSGNGDYALEWMPHVRSFTATEADPVRFAQLRERFVEEPRVHTRHLVLPASDSAEHTAVCALNVLEHIPDDVEALQAMARLIRPSGAIVLIVPAFPSAMSRFDREIGHVRRYTKRTLADSLSRADLRIVRLQYLNPLGLLSWYVGPKLLRLTPRSGPVLRAYDRTVIPVAKLIQKVLGAPFGQSVFAVARQNIS